MMFTKKKRLTMAVAGAVSLGTSGVYAADFNASTTLQNTVEVTVVQDFDIGTVFATTTGFASTGAAFEDGVGAFVIDPVDGNTDTAPASVSATVALTSISTPTPAQGSVAAVGPFTLELPDTSTILAADFIADGTPSLANILTEAGGAVELEHESLNPSVPSLYMMHFTMVAADAADGTVTASTVAVNNGLYSVEPAFGVTDFIFNIGATITTEPYIDPATPKATPLQYQEGLYSGTFEVTATY